MEDVTDAKPMGTKQGTVARRKRQRTREVRQGNATHVTGPVT